MSRPRKRKEPLIIHRVFEPDRLSQETLRAAYERLVPNHSLMISEKGPLEPESQEVQHQKEKVG